jgi:hypothetical protein
MFIRLEPPSVIGNVFGVVERRGEGQQGRVQITKLGQKYQHD